MIAITYYEKVKALCDERKLSIRALEIACEFSNGSVRKWNESVPRIDRLQKVAAVLGVKLEDITEDCK